MAFTQYLNIDGTDMPLPVSYDLALSDVEADSSGETEAGTTQRDIVRSGVAQISVSFQVSPAWLKSCPRCVGSQSSQSTFLIQKQWSRPEKCTSTVSKLPLHTTPAEKGLWKVSELKEY